MMVPAKDIFSRNIAAHGISIDIIISIFGGYIKTFFTDHYDKLRLNPNP